MFLFQSHSLPFVQDIVAPLLNVAELRKLGITLHMLIEKPRQRVPDVLAIYFVQPTEKNIEYVIKDCERNLYDEVTLNFSTSIPRPLLESLAQKSISASVNSKFTQILDQYLEFVSLEPGFLTLNHKNSFALINGVSSEDALMVRWPFVLVLPFSPFLFLLLCPSFVSLSSSYLLFSPSVYHTIVASDTQIRQTMMIQNYIDSLVESVFCIIGTLGVIPVIRCQPNGAAAMVGQKLEQRIREHLQSQGNLFSNKTTSNLLMNRPGEFIFRRVHVSRSILS